MACAGPKHSLCYSLLGMRMASIRVMDMIPAVMAINLPCGMGGATCSSMLLSGNSSEFMLTRQGNTISGKLSITVSAKPEGGSEFYYYCENVEF